MSRSTSEAAEIKHLYKSYRTRGRLSDAVRWADAHLAGTAVIAETSRSVYVFVPIYAGKQHIRAPGGAFRFAGFSAGAREEEVPKILICRPHDVKVGEKLRLSLAEDRRRNVSGVLMGEITVDLTKSVSTSKVERMYLIPIDFDT